MRNSRALGPQGSPLMGRELAEPHHTPRNDATLSDLSLPARRQLRGRRRGVLGDLGLSGRKSRETSEGNKAEALLAGRALEPIPDDSHETPNPVTRQIMAPEAGLILPPPPPPRDELGGGGQFLPGQGPEPAGNSGRSGSHSPSSLAL